MGDDAGLGLWWGYGLASESRDATPKWDSLEESWKIGKNRLFQKNKLNWSLKAIDESGTMVSVVLLTVLINLARSMVSCP